MLKGEPQVYESLTGCSKATVVSVCTKNFLRLTNRNVLIHGGLSEQVVG